MQTGSNTGDFTVIDALYIYNSATYDEGCYETLIGSHVNSINGHHCPCSRMISENHSCPNNFNFAQQVN